MAQRSRNRHTSFPAGPYDRPLRKNVANECLEEKLGALRDRVDQLESEREENTRRYTHFLGETKIWNENRMIEHRNRDEPHEIAFWTAEQTMMYNDKLRAALDVYNKADKRFGDEIEKTKNRMGAVEMRLQTRMNRG